MKRHRVPLLIIISFFLTVSAPAQAANSVKAPLPVAEMMQRGKVVYQNYCIGCHGAKGNGKGAAAYGLFPKPRDFTRGVFKFRSTPSGHLPTDEDLYRTIRQGVYGVSMPAYKLMPTPEILSVIQYIKTFSSAWEKQPDVPEIEHIPPLPKWFGDEQKRKAKAEEGKTLYTQFCVACHGVSGKGDGFAMANLKDEWNEKIYPADLRKPFIKSGRNLSDIYKSMVTGISGSPMPSYKDAATEEQLWAIVAYIDQLRRDYQKEKESQ